MSKTLATAHIFKTGPGTSIQDLGRMDYGKYGIPTSGCMDSKSSQWVNLQLNNPNDAAVLEISQPGLGIRFSAPTMVSIAGAQAQVLQNGKEVGNPSLIPIMAKDQLEIGQFITGARVYLGIKYGFKSQLELGSRSFFKEITPLPYFSKEGKVSFWDEASTLGVLHSKAKWDHRWFEKEELEVYLGPDWRLLDQETKSHLLTASFHISPLTNRMGAQLLETVENKLPELPTNPVFPGTVQLTSGGKIIILGQDAQVTGGYPRIFQLSDLALSILAQKKPGQVVRFSKLVC
ncbi:biotin-dependent carboxyltransferase family protein [Algoriphagus confluentis]|uniref:Biotin-dependent carboxyltransferase family protein n=1 Tax=Algoriphagus confluentis TaxID=1697556 RepID=A0ABQ6PJW1_9BACT|nr:biotin-dependent carboxyltransferase family protein [Algoriphagus confluentis]